MNMSLVDPALVAVVLLNFFLLATTRLRAIIYGVALQGIILGVIYPLMHREPSGGSDGMNISVRLLALAAAMIVIKGVVMPRMLLYAMQRTNSPPKIEPYIGITASMLIGALATAAVIAFAAKLPLKEEHASNLLVPAALATVLISFLLLTTRREALMQVLGYLVLENGIFIFGLLLIDALPVLVELGVLLDLFVAVFVMEIILHHVSRQFPSTTSDHLSTLRE
jgi:hydrogenase-4 component E